MLERIERLYFETIKLSYGREGTWWCAILLRLAFKSRVAWED